jgi:Fe-S-cluster containining protein
MTVGIPPFYREGKEWELLPELLRREIEAVPIVPNTILNQPCMWFDAETLSCKNYELRPQICREFKVDGDGCRVYRIEFQIDGVLSGV